MTSFPAPIALPPGQGSVRTRKLPRCEACWLPISRCICDALSPFEVQTRLVLIVHHMERMKSSNTGRLVARMIPSTMARVHGDPSRAPRVELPEGRRLVLFPSQAAPVLTREMAAEGPVVLLVPDGTWQQAKRMVVRDPDAKRAEVVRLPDGQTTRFGALRRNTREGTSSTMEAIARALGILEGPEAEERLLSTFEKFLEATVYVRTHASSVAVECARMSGATESGEDAEEGRLVEEGNG